MKRIGNLFESVCSFRNLLMAGKNALKGKKDNIRSAKFFLNMETEIFDIQRELLSGNYQPGQYHCFDIFEPKPRYICAADFRDRVVHHAICNVLEPVFEKIFISDSYACRKKKGSHMAVRRVQSFCRKSCFFLKADIRKYFESVDHAVLKHLLRRKIRDKKLLNLLDIVIEHPYPGQTPGKGLPIGNLTSQWWANFYLDHLDHHIKEELRVKFYVRYMDDLALLSDDKAELHLLKSRIAFFINEKLKLAFKEGATYIAPVHQGLPFLGFRIFPGVIRLKRENRLRFERSIRNKEKAYLSGKINETALIRSVQSMVGHIRNADTGGMRQKFFSGRYEG